MKKIIDNLVGRNVKENISKYANFDLEKTVKDFFSKNNNLILPFIITLAIGLVAYGAKLTLPSFAADDSVSNFNFMPTEWLYSHGLPFNFLPLKFAILNFNVQFFIITLSHSLKIATFFIIFKSLFKEKISNFTLIVVSSICLTFVYYLEVSYFMGIGIVIPLSMLLLVYAVILCNGNIISNIFACLLIFFCLGMYQPVMGYYITFSILLFFNYFLNNYNQKSLREIFTSHETKLLIKRAFVAVIGAGVYYALIELLYSDIITYVSEVGLVTNLNTLIHNINTTWEYSSKFFQKNYYLGNHMLINLLYLFIVISFYGYIFWNICSSRNTNILQKAIIMSMVIFITFSMVILTDITIFLQERYIGDRLLTHIALMIGFMFVFLYQNLSKKLLKSAICFVAIMTIYYASVYTNIIHTLGSVAYTNQKAYANNIALDIKKIMSTADDTNKPYTFMFLYPEKRVPRPSNIPNIENSQIVQGSLYNYWSLSFLIKSAYTHMHPSHNIIFPAATSPEKQKKVRSLPEKSKHKTSPK